MAGAQIYLGWLLSSIKIFSANRGYFC